MMKKHLAFFVLISLNNEWLKQNIKIYFIFSMMNISIENIDKRAYFIIHFVLEEESKYFSA